MALLRPEEIQMMKALYERLYNDTNISYRYDGKKVPLQELSHFVSMKGSEFSSDQIRLFVIGRAVNGWESLPCDSAEEFAAAAVQEFNSPGFTWIADNGTSHYSLHNIPADGQPVYYLSRSPFWRIIEKVWRGLTGSDDFRFVEHLAWSNLYKIAPSCTGNPTTTMCKRQFTACREILKAEIQAYKPTHILFITGYDWWYADRHCDFSTLFENNSRIGSNNSDKSIFVEGTSEYRLDGKKIPVVITCRPERRDEAAMTEAILKAIC
jgi:hypothetical protein